MPLFPRSLIWQFSQRYIAGTRLEDAFERVRELNAVGCSGTIDVLGEDSTEEVEIRAAIDLYLRALEEINTQQIDCGVSIKLSEMGLRYDEGRCRQAMDEVVAAASKRQQFVRIDMEDSTVTDVTLDIYTTLRSRYPNVGAVIQACLRRSETDVAELLRGGATDLRLCKGIYIEPEEIAYRDPEEIRQSFNRLLEQLLADSKARVGIATHDPALVDFATDVIERLQVAKERYEFQMLLGVAGPLRRRLVAAGHPLRVLRALWRALVQLLDAAPAGKPEHCGTHHWQPVSTALTMFFQRRFIATAAIITLFVMPVRLNAATDQASYEDRISELEAKVQRLEALIEEQAVVLGSCARVEEVEEAVAACARVEEVEALAEAVDPPTLYDETDIKVGGYVKMDGILSDYSNSPTRGVGEDLFVPSTINTSGDPAGPQLNLHAKETRFWLKSNTPIGGGDISTYFEIDFLGQQGDERVGNSSSARIRHASLQWNRWTVGQTWTNFFNVSTLPAYLDFVGPVGTTFGRQAQFRYTVPTSNGSLAFSLENPETTLTPFGGGDRIDADDSRYPDVVMRRDWSGDWGNVSALQHWFAN